jgi:hypothetical protein
VKRHWHNRNRIKTANGVEWLTIPVVVKGRFEQVIEQVEIEKGGKTLARDRTCLQACRILRALCAGGEELVRSRGQAKSPDWRPMSGGRDGF